MKVLTICKMNQARSALAEAVIRRFLPNLEISSAGVQAVSNTPYLTSVVQLSRKWGVAIAEGGSKTLDLSLELIEADLVICAEAWMKDDPRIQAADRQVVSYEDFASDSSFMPFDPETMTGRTLETELAKVAWVNLRAVRELWSGFFQHEIVVVIPETEFQTESAIAFARERAADTSGLIIDADVRSPIPGEFRRSGLSVGPISLAEGAHSFEVLSGIVEKSQPEAFLLSMDWRDLLADLCVDRPLYLVTAPQIIPTGPLPDAYLAAIWASEIHVIRR
ncbi:MAG: hypothetical protein WCO08_02160 [Actinomycetes bacterium]